MKTLFKVHFYIEFNNNSWSCFLDEDKINEGIADRYDQEFATLDDAVKYAQETYIPLFCEENADMYGALLPEEIDGINSDLAKLHFTDEVIFNGDNLCCMILRKESLRKKHLWDLRQECSVGSCYISDYENSFGYSSHDVCVLFDDYLDYCQELADLSDDKNWYDFDTEKTMMDFAESYDYDFVTRWASI